MLRSAAELSARCLSVASSLGPKETARRLGAVTDAVRPVAAREARADLGADGAFSGWRRGKPIPLEVRGSPHRDGAGITIHPARNAAGPWRVAESGRNMGETGAFLGPGVNRRTGETARTKAGAVRRVRGVKARRWNGYTQGKGTWSRGVPSMVRAGAPVLRKSTQQAAVRAFLGRR